MKRMRWPVAVLPFLLTLAAAYGVAFTPLGTMRLRIGV